MLNNIKKAMRLSLNSAEGMNIVEGRREINNRKRDDSSVKVSSGDNSEGR